MRKVKWERGIEVPESISIFPTGELKILVPSNFYPRIASPALMEICRNCRLGALRLKRR